MLRYPLGTSNIIYNLISAAIFQWTNKSNQRINQTKVIFAILIFSPFAEPTRSHCTIIH